VLVPQAIHIYPAIACLPEGVDASAVACAWLCEKLEGAKANNN
jgi:hypothetical protein